MVDVSIDFDVFFSVVRGGGGSCIVSSRHEKVEGRRRACHESSWIFYGSSKIRDICAEHLSGKRLIPLF